MTEAMPSPPESSSARRAQFLATEHWSLLATRSMSWNESFARSSMFLTSLSTATVALALVGSATQFGPEFVAGQPHVIWRRIGRHEILARP